MEIARVEPRDVQQCVDDRRQALGLRRDVAEERHALLLAEEHVLAEERLGEAVDRRERAAKLVRDGGDELALHLLDQAVGGDVAEGEDAPGDGARGIAHDGLGHREPHLLGAALDRDEPARLRRRTRGCAGGRLDRAAERVAGGHARDALGGIVPQDDVRLAVDGDDPVGDVREDRVAPLAVDGDRREELGVRERGRRVRGKRLERLDLLGPPRSRPVA